MSDATPRALTLDMIRQSLYSSVVCDALDALGYRRQSPGIPWRQLTLDSTLVGRCKTTRWAEREDADPAPYELELLAVDSCRPDDVLIAAADGSMKSGIWGELLSTAALHRGCVGAILDGAARDVAAMCRLGFPVYARGTSIYDSKDRQYVTEFDVPVEIDGVPFHPGDLVIADADGVVVVPQEIEQETLARAWAKVHDENLVRDAVRGGMPASEAYRRYGVL